MVRKRNLMPLGGLLLGMIAVASYFTIVNTFVAPRVPFLRNVPILNLGLMAVALWLSFVGIRRAFRLSAEYRGKTLAPALAGLNAFLAAFFGWYLFSYSSTLPVAASAPKVGDGAPDFTLPDHRGNNVRLASLRGKNVLLVFYRGHW